MGKQGFDARTALANATRRRSAGFGRQGFPKLTTGRETVDELHPALHSNHDDPLFVGIYKGIIIPGFLRWCETDFVHPQ